MTYFVAGHGGNIAFTDDPATGWNTATAGTSDVRAIACTDRYTYAGCADGKVYKSSSGASWSLVHTFDHRVVRAAYLPWSEDILFALTDGWLGGLRSGYGWYEWQEWTQLNSGIYGVAGLLEGETPATLEEIRMVIAGNGGRLATADGWYASPGWMQWTERTTPFGGTPILAVARGDGMWVCGGGEGKLAYSSDGIDWTLTDSGFDGSCIYHIAFDMVLGWLAVGAEGKVSRSLDGVIWDAVDMASESDCAVDYSGWRVDHRWLGAVAAGNCWMVAGDGNVVATLCECPDCYTGNITWWFEVCYRGTLYSSQFTDSYDGTFINEQPNNDMGVRAVSSNGDVYTSYGRGDEGAVLKIYSDGYWGGGGGDYSCDGEFFGMFVFGASYVRFEGSMYGVTINSLILTGSL